MNAQILPINISKNATNIYTGCTLQKFKHLCYEMCPVPLPLRVLSEIIRISVESNNFT